MNIFVLDTEFSLTGVVDTFNSFIWTDRYDECGEFQLQVSATTENLSIFKQNYYLQILESEHTMIIESIQINYDSDSGNSLVISGRSFESILDRRIVWGTITFSAKKSIQSVIQKLLTDAFMTSGDRYVSGFEFVENSELASSPVLNDDDSSGYGAQYTGDNIYETVTALCSDAGLGFKIGVTDTGTMQFSLYNGVDRSYDNENNNPYVVFSPKFENILNSNYLESKSNLKTITYIAGEGEGTARKTASYGSSETGLDRRELFTDARDISASSYDEDGNEITIGDTAYSRLLIQRGTENLTEYTDSVSFEGEADVSNAFVYGQDFSLGDIIQLEDSFGHSARCRVSEMVVSYDTSGGYKVYPTFKLIKEDE